MMFECPIVTHNYSRSSSAAVSQVKVFISQAKASCEVGNWLQSYDWSYWIYPGSFLIRAPCREGGSLLKPGLVVVQD